MTVGERWKFIDVVPEDRRRSGIYRVCGSMSISLYDRECESWQCSANLGQVRVGELVTVIRHTGRFYDIKFTSNFFGDRWSVLWNSAVYTVFDDDAAWLEEVEL